MVKMTSGSWWNTSQKSCIVVTITTQLYLLSNSWPMKAGVTIMQVKANANARNRILNDCRKDEEKQLMFFCCYNVTLFHFISIPDSALATLWLVESVENFHATPVCPVSQARTGNLENPQLWYGEYAATALNYAQQTWKCEEWSAFVLKQ